MSRPCSVCRHPDRAAIDAALVSGDSYRGLSGRFGTSKSALERHREHLPRGLALAREAEAATRADDLLERTRSLEVDARRLLAKAEKEGDFRAAIAAVKTALDVIAVLHRVADTRKTTYADFLDSPEWQQIETTLIEALRPYPPALEAAGRALEAIGEATR